MPVSPEHSIQPSVLRPIQVLIRCRASHNRRQLVHLRRCSSSSLIYLDCENTVANARAPCIISAVDGRLEGTRGRCREVDLRGVMMTSFIVRCKGNAKGVLAPFRK